MEKEEKVSVKLSFIVTVIERDFEDLLRLIESYKDLTECSETELIIEAESLSEKSVERLRKYVEEVPQVRWFMNPNTSRCWRKDLGMLHAESDYLAYIDADCVFQKVYYLEIRKLLGKHRVIRGKNIYQAEKNYLSMCNKAYRTLCDEVVFRNETFTPNLVIRKDFLKKNGGWATDNTDSGDDYTLSQRLKQRDNFTIAHCDKAILEIKNSRDEKWEKISRTWKGYGKAYQVRRKNAGECNLKSFLQYIPPFVYRRTAPFSYFPMAIVNWVVLFTGYCEQIITERKKGEKNGS